MTTRGKQFGYTMIWILASIGASLLAGYGFGLLADFIPKEKPPALPIFLMASLILPSTITTQLILKLSDIKKTKGLSREELRRLEQIISLKTTRLYLLLAFYALTAIVIGTMFYAASLQTPPAVLLWTLRATGFLLLLSAVMSIYSVIETRKIGAFEAKIVARSQERKAKAALLKRLKDGGKN